MLKYDEVLTKKVLSKTPFYNHKSGDVSYRYENVTYLVRNGEIICHGKRVRSFSNMDYAFEDDEDCTNLMRNGKLLYKTEPNYVIVMDNSFKDMKSGVYLLGDKHGDLIGSISFPIKTSVLSVIDDKLKEVNYVKVHQSLNK